MPDQLDLFGPTHRRHDHHTSVAAGTVNPSYRRGDRKTTLLVYYRHQKGLSDHDLEEITGRQYNSIGKRRTDLTKAGLVEWSGATKPSPCGYEVKVWRITPAGIALAELILGITPPDAPQPAVAEPPTPLTPLTGGAAEEIVF
jgi:hypothetical protein